MSAPVAVIDIGSNSIKVLVAKRESSGELTMVKMKTIEARISAGISGEEPRLSEEGIQRGLAAVKELLAIARPYNPSAIVLVATSAVRDAVNGRDFQDRIAAETGERVRILSGEEEANLIGRGLTCDPALRDLRDFYLFDLGGGSLECLSFRDRSIRQAVSLPLGCVRLTERFSADPTAPYPSVTDRAVRAHTREVLRNSGFQFDLPATATAVGTGGTLTTARQLSGRGSEVPLEQTSSRLPTTELADLLLGIGQRSLAERRKMPSMPHGRADVMPVALSTMLAVADAGGFTAYQHSLYNLRWGLADELLAVRS